MKKKIYYDKNSSCKPKLIGYSEYMNKTIKTLIERSQKDTLTTRTYGKGYVLASGLLEIKQAEKTGWELICEKLPNAYVFKIK